MSSPELWSERGCSRFLRCSRHRDSLLPLIVRVTPSHFSLIITLTRCKTQFMRAGLTKEATKGVVEAIPSGLMY